MNAVLLNGLRDGDATPALETAVFQRLGACGHTTEHFVLRRMHIAPCTGCFGCWIKSPGICVQDDDGRAVARAMIEADLVVLLTSVAFGGYSSELKKALDRAIGNILPFFGRFHGEVHHRPRYERGPVFVGVGVVDKPDEEAVRIFATLVERNAVNLHATAHASMVLTGEDGEALHDALDKVFQLEVA